LDRESDPKLDSNLASEQHPASELSHGNQRSNLLQIAKAVVALATGLPQFNNKLRNCQACGILLSNLD
jgi:hypothetical protein